MRSGTTVCLALALIVAAGHLMEGTEATRQLHQYQSFTFQGAIMPPPKYRPSSGSSSSSGWSSGNPSLQVLTPRPPIMYAPRPPLRYIPRPEFIPLPKPTSRPVSVEPAGHDTDYATSQGPEKSGVPDPIRQPKPPPTEPPEPEPEPSPSPKPVPSPSPRGVISANPIPGVTNVGNGVPSTAGSSFGGINNIVGARQQPTGANANSLRQVTQAEASVVTQVQWTPNCTIYILQAKAQADAKAQAEAHAQALALALAKAQAQAQAQAQAPALPACFCSNNETKWDQRHILENRFCHQQPCSLNGGCCGRVRYIKQEGGQQALQIGAQSVAACYACIGGCGACGAAVAAAAIQDDLEAQLKSIMKALKDNAAMKLDADTASKLEAELREIISVLATKVASGSGVNMGDPAQDVAAMLPLKSMPQCTFAVEVGKATYHSRTCAPQPAYCKCGDHWEEYQLYLAWRLKCR